MKDRTFTYPKIVNLIHLYRENSCLWDISSPDFRRQNRRQAALSKIAKVFNTAASDVKRKIRSLRATYLLERRKVLASQKKVENNSEQHVYEPVLAWYKYMSFLDDIIVFRTPTANENVEKPSEMQTDTKDHVESSQTHLEKIEEIYYDNDDDSHDRHEEMTMPPEYIEPKYLFEEKSMDKTETGNALGFFVDTDLHSSDDERNEGKNEKLIALKADRIRAETEYFQKKTEYLDVCIEKERQLQPLLIAKLRLEIENLTKKNRETD